MKVKDRGREKDEKEPDKRCRREDSTGDSNEINRVKMSCNLR